MGSVRMCRQQDLPRVAEIFRNSFLESVEALVPTGPPALVVFEDIFAFLLRALPRDFLVAEIDGQVQGYIVTPTVSMGKVWARAFCSGTLLRWAGKWALGYYYIPLGNMLGIIKNKLMFVRTEKTHSPPGKYGRILTLAVAPEHRGLGLGKLLVECGLAHMTRQGLDYVKLEVRPGNISALKAYTGLGFKEIGRTQDVQGEWLVMVKDIH